MNAGKSFPYGYPGILQGYASEIVPALADKGQYLASGSTFYRVLRQEGMAGRRGQSQQPPVKRKISTHYATGLNQVWMWDIKHILTDR